MDIYLDLEESYSWYKLPKLEQIKIQYEFLTGSTSPIAYEMNLRDWKYVTETPELLTLNEALEKFKKPKDDKQHWLKRLLNIKIVNK